MAGNPKLMRFFTATARSLGTGALEFPVRESAPCSIGTHQVHPDEGTCAGSSRRKGFVRNN